ncbi:MAG: polysaccharide deacetylase [Labilithrix sp.]|nr:polysaccharide deacetylase [Labilithrix sp.]
MPAVTRALLYAAAVAAGTWAGLGAPGLREAPLVPHVAAEQGPRTDGVPKLPQLENAESLPSLRPWPQLNAEASIDKAWMVAEGPAYAPGSGRRYVTLTFDDGPFPDTTPQVLRVLARHHVQATFFVIGQYLDGDSRRARRSREVVRKTLAAGHLVGNHTHDHQRLARRTHTQVLEQIDQGQASIERATGKRPILFRPPFGELDEFGRAAVRERGLDLLLWSVEKQDMRREDTHEVFKELVRQIEYKDGGVVLLHDIRRPSLVVLEELLGWLDAHRWNPAEPAKIGYDVVDLPTYLREVQAAPLPYERRDELEVARRRALEERDPDAPRSPPAPVSLTVPRG